MIYSVWDPQRHVYTYYKGPSPKYGDVPTPAHIKRQPLGVAVDDAAWPLPGGCLRIGEGREARGMIATSGGPSGLDTTWVVIAGLLISGYSLNKVLR